MAHFLYAPPLCGLDAQMEKCKSLQRFRRIFRAHCYRIYASAEPHDSDRMAILKITSAYSKKMPERKRRSGIVLIVNLLIGWRFQQFGIFQQLFQQLDCFGVVIAVGQTFVNRQTEIEHFMHLIRAIGLIHRTH